MMEDLVAKPGATKSPVWAYFGFVAGIAEADGKPANKEMPVCRVQLNRSYEGQQHVKPVVASQEQPTYHLLPDKGQLPQNVCNQVEAADSSRH